MRQLVEKAINDLGYLEGPLNDSNPKLCWRALSSIDELEDIYNLDSLHEASQTMQGIWNMLESDFEDPVEFMEANIRKHIRKGTPNFVG